MVTKRDALFYQISTLPTSYVPKIEDYPLKLDDGTEKHKISAFNVPPVQKKEAKLSQWEYLDAEKVQTLLTLTDQKEIFEYIGRMFTNVENFCRVLQNKMLILFDVGSTLKNYPTGRPKDFFIQLLSDVTKFCQSQSYDLEKVASVLSQFYLTHNYFTSSVDVSAEKVYIYFKDLMMCHSLPFPPCKKKIFTLNEARDILEFFCRIYTRNLPLIKYLCLPNFALYLNYEIPPAPVFVTKGKKVTGKEKKEKKGKGKKKK
ncbi:uncharacterized protein LOC126745447 isoform X1 [Anthonomus grandis grandis]|uniref:uncharacterized protein LOC126745447 isoform X1 n=1 Tax=Anthonomus grandis grandis TaxID=2921223 RepID=UPI0021657551|nr:uncharacterized protein LOC126745447 isoform X1 [Anthonomus grandis grandis]